MFDAKESIEHSLAECIIKDYTVGINSSFRDHGRLARPPEFVSSLNPGEVLMQRMELQAYRSHHQGFIHTNTQLRKSGLVLPSVSRTLLPHAPLATLSPPPPPPPPPAPPPAPSPRSSPRSPRSPRSLRSPRPVATCATRPVPVLQTALARRSILVYRGAVACCGPDYETLCADARAVNGEEWLRKALSWLQRGIRRVGGHRTGIIDGTALLASFTAGAPPTPLPAPPLWCPDGSTCNLTTVEYSSLVITAACRGFLLRQAQRAARRLQALARGHLARRATAAARAAAAAADKAFRASAADRARWFVQTPPAFRAVLVLYSDRAQTSQQLPELAPALVYSNAARSVVAVSAGSATDISLSTASWTGAGAGAGAAGQRARYVGVRPARLGLLQQLAGHVSVALALDASPKTCLEIRGLLSHSAQVLVVVPSGDVSDDVWRIAQRWNAAVTPAAPRMSLPSRLAVLATAPPLAGAPPLTMLPPRTLAGARDQHAVARALVALAAPARVPAGEAGATTVHAGRLALRRGYCAVRTGAETRAGAGAGEELVLLVGVGAVQGVSRISNVVDLVTTLSIRGAPDVVLLGATTTPPNAPRTPPTHPTATPWMKYFNSTAPPYVVTTTSAAEVAAAASALRRAAAAAAPAPLLPAPLRCRPRTCLLAVLLDVAPGPSPAIRVCGVVGCHGPAVDEGGGAGLYLLPPPLPAATRAQLVGDAYAVTRAAVQDTDGGGGKVTVKILVAQMPYDGIVTCLVDVSVPGEFTGPKKLLELTESLSDTSYDIDTGLFLDETLKSTIHATTTFTPAPIGTAPSDSALRAAAAADAATLATALRRADATIGAVKRIRGAVLTAPITHPALAAAASLFSDRRMQFDRVNARGVIPLVVGRELGAPGAAVELFALAETPNAALTLAAGVMAALAACTATTHTPGDTSGLGEPPTPLSELLKAPTRTEFWNMISRTGRRGTLESVLHSIECAKMQMSPNF